MSKQRHKFVFFIEPTDKDDESATTIGNFYMNRFAIDEDAGHEIVNIYAPKKYNYKKIDRTEVETEEQIGTDQIFSSKIVVKWGASFRLPSSL